jgi:hypothetical protein
MHTALSAPPGAFAGSTVPSPAPNPGCRRLIMPLNSSLTATSWLAALPTRSPGHDERLTQPGTRHHTSRVIRQRHHSTATRYALPAPAEPASRNSPAPPPPTRLLPNLGTDGFCQDRLRVYMSHASWPEAVGLRSQTVLTGSGSPRYSYGGLGGGHPHFHPAYQRPEAGSHNLALSAWESVPSGPVTWPDLRGRLSPE